MYKKLSSRWRKIWRKKILFCGCWTLNCQIRKFTFFNILFVVGNVADAAAPPIVLLVYLVLVTDAAAATREASNGTLACGCIKAMHNSYLYYWTRVLCLNVPSMSVRPSFHLFVSLSFCLSVIQPSVCPFSCMLLQHIRKAFKPPRSTTTAQTNISSVPMSVLAFRRIRVTIHFIFFTFL